MNNLTILCPSRVLFFTLLNNLYAVHHWLKGLVPVFVVMWIDDRKVQNSIIQQHFLSQICLNSMLEIAGNEFNRLVCVNLLLTWLFRWI